jgi:hypothetical protein
MMPRLSILACLGVVACGGAPGHKFRSPGELLARIDSQSSCSNAIQGEARVAFKGDARRLSASVDFLAHVPHQLRFDVVHSIAGTVATLTSDGERFALSSLEEKRFYEGPARACNVARFTQVPAPPSVFVELLRNRVPHLSNQTVRPLGEHSPLFGTFYYELVLERGGLREQAYVSVHPDDYNLPPARQRLRVDYFSFESAGVKKFDAVLGGYEPGAMATSSLSPEEIALGLPPAQLSGPECHAELPTRARFAVEANGFELEFSAMKLLHNPALGEQSFRQPTRSDLALTAVDCVEEPSPFVESAALAKVPVSP